MASLPAHLYPGAGLRLRDLVEGRRDGPCYPIGAHQNLYGATSELLTIREVAMMALMDQLTDKADWHKKVFDDSIVAKWHQEAMAQPEDELYRHITEGKEHDYSGRYGGYRRSDKIPKPRARILSEKAFDYCIAELRTKARFCKKTGLVHTLDSVSATIVKSDNSMAPALHDSLKAGFKTLIAEQQSQVDWHPRSQEMVQDLVHPSMYPLIYGQSQFLPNEAVGVSDAVREWAGLGEVLPKVEPDEVPPGSRFTYGIGGWTVPPNFWSDTYQWLPANLAFQQDGTVKFTSYINNLHPEKHHEIYRTIEQLVDLALPAWDHCLVPYPPARGSGSRQKQPRVKVPHRAYDDNEKLWEPMHQALERGNFDPSTDELLRLARDRGINLDEELDREQPELNTVADDSARREHLVGIMRKNHPVEIEEWKWKRIRDPIIPEPRRFSRGEIDYSLTEDLKTKFREMGLQVIVKMATIELTPEKPEFPVGGWHIEGMMNEHICATALYYLDSENVTDSYLSFRMQTSYYQEELQEKTRQDSYNWLERVHGTALGSADGLTNSCLQNYGSVQTRQGRLLAFPNTFQHRVSSFKLQDPTKPGHRRFIALWLVDPHRRIVSTANVPPQQLDWWVEAVFGGDAKAEQGCLPPELLQLVMERRGVASQFPKNSGSDANSRLPNEVMDMIREKGIVPKGLMDIEEARAHRLKLMDERSQFHQVSEKEWEKVSYSFCEH